jgi:hypothetical protein
MNSRLKNLAIVLTLALAQNCAVAAEHNGKLDKLGASLRYLRALAPGAKTSLRCPSHLEKMHDVSVVSLVAVLGKPDHTSGNERSYYLVSPAPDGKRAGGYPVITFTSSAAGTVGAVSCSYAK